MAIAAIIAITTITIINSMSVNPRDFIYVAPALLQVGGRESRITQKCRAPLEALYDRRLRPDDSGISYGRAFWNGERRPRLVRRIKIAEPVVRVVTGFGNPYLHQEAWAA